jgi:adenylate kinase family enzyme
VISRVIIHVDGSPGAGKTTFVERLLGAVDEWALAVRCRRDKSLRYARESSSARAPEMRRYRAAGGDRRRAVHIPVRPVLSGRLLQ